MNAPTERDWTSVKRILRYLKGTRDHGLIFNRQQDPSITAYADADWAEDKSRRSRSGNIVLLGTSPINWSSKLQQGLPALSTVEAEYRSAGSAVQEMLWINNILKELDHHIKLKLNLPMELMEDNQGAIAAIKNPVQHGKLKHLDLRHHFIRAAVKDNGLTVTYCKTEDMTADILTKPLAPSKFKKLRLGLGLREIGPRGDVDLLNTMNQSDRDICSEET